MTIRQVPGPDAAFLYGERPEWHFHVSALTIVDASESERFSADEVIDQLRRRLHKLPQFRWKLMEAPLGMRLERPIWVDDPDFDLSNHVHRVGVPSPGDDHALGTLVGRLVSFKIDRSRPLWEIWIIEGLEDGRVGLLAKIHHSMIDGQSGAEMATLLYDLERDPEPLPEPPPYDAEPAPAITQRLVLGGFNAAAWPLRASKMGLQMARQSVTMARHALGDAPPAQPLQGPRTPLNGKLTPDRSFAKGAVSLSDAKKVKDAFEVKLNDVILAISATALRNYLATVDSVPENPLVAQVPVSLRDEANKSDIGTKVANMFCSLATDIDDPVERLRAIHESSQRGKVMRQELTDQQAVNFTETTPPALIAIAARAWSMAELDARTPPIFNLIISNVAGPPFDLFCAGAKIEAMYPMGPLLAGTGVNFTVVSSADRLDFGVMACPSLVPDPWAIAEEFGPALEVLLEAADESA